MNGQYNPFIYRLLYAQQFLNKALAKREINNRSVCFSQLLFWSVEILLREYIAYYQYGYTLIHQFNKKRWITGLQVAALWRYRSVRPSLSVRTDIPDYSSVGRWCMSVRSLQGSVSSIPATLFALDVSPP